MARYLVTGGTGLMGRHVVERLARQEDAAVYVLVRAASVSKFLEQANTAGIADAVIPVVGDLTADRLGLSEGDLSAVQGVEHLVHVAAVYDLTADEATQQSANVDGTRRVIELAQQIGTDCLHHVSSVVVAGDHEGTFSEDAIDVGQNLPTPYQRTKFEAERLIRETAEVPWRIYRPSIIVGDSKTGEMDKVDGIYYMLPTLATLASVPGGRFIRLPRVDLGSVNVVPVDWVADAMVALMHRSGLDGRAFHLTHSEMQPMVETLDQLAKAAGAPRFVIPLPRLPLTGKVVGAVTGSVSKSDLFGEVSAKIMDQIGVPAEGLELRSFTSTLTNEATVGELAASGVAACPDVASFISYLADERAAYAARAGKYTGDIDRLRQLYLRGMSEMNNSLVYPDANSTLRFTYGNVKGYSPREAVTYTPFTTLKGVLEKDTGVFPFDAPGKLRTLQETKNFGRYGVGDSVPVNFLATTDIIGGNSGSPIMNAYGEQVGIIFDGNYEGLGNDLFFDPNYGRSIAVDIRYVLFVTEKFADSKWIVDEMTLKGGAQTKAAKK